MEIILWFHEFLIELDFRVLVLATLQLSYLFCGLRNYLAYYF